jgi:hypothetical protein
MAKQSNDELAYKEFLKQISKLSAQFVPDDGITTIGKQRKSANEVYQELCYDFPLVTKDELEILKNYLQKIQLNGKPDSLRVARRSFYDGILYGVRKHQSTASDPSKTNTTEKQVEDPETLQISKIYFQICAIIFIKFVKYYLQLAINKDLETLNKELSLFKLKKTSESSKYDESESDNQIENVNKEEEILLAKDQDDDNTPYETFGGNSNFFAFDEKGVKFFCFSS